MSKRSRSALAVAVLLGLMATVIVIVAGFWAMAYEPLLDPYPNGEVHVYYPGTTREITDFEHYAISGVVAASQSCFAVGCTRPLNSLRKKLVAASTGPTLLLFAATGFVLWWWASTGFVFDVIAASAPFMVVVATSALASSAGFFGAIEAAQKVHLHGLNTSETWTA